MKQVLFGMIDMSSVDIDFFVAGQCSLPHFVKLHIPLTNIFRDSIEGID